MGDQTGNFLEGVKNKEIQSLAKLLSFIDERGPSIFFEYPELLNPPRPSFRVGITGPPGAGKSTLVNGLVEEFRKKDFSVGVLAVDPSSPFTQGAILGDRIRYHDHFIDRNVFIRSLGTRGSLGGLSASTYLMLRAFDLFSFDIVIVETVGVGQTELDIMHVADLIAVVLVPESGDSIQVMKAGLIEIADLYVINKSDRPGADSLAKEVRASSDQSKPVFSTVATDKKGLADWICFIEEKKSQINLLQERSSIKKLRQEAKALLMSGYQDKALSEASKINDLSSFQEIFR